MRQFKSKKLANKITELNHRRFLDKVGLIFVNNHFGFIVDSAVQIDDNGTNRN